MHPKRREVEETDQIPPKSEGLIPMSLLMVQKALV